MALTLTEKLAQRKKDREAIAADANANKDPANRATPPPRTAESSNSLLRQQMEAANIDQSVRYIDIDLLDIEEQVRNKFDEEYIQDLAIDFALNETHPYQPKNPITVYERPNGRFLVDTGENRTRAIMYGREHREELGVSDVTAFTQIRATVQGPEPDKIDRIQSQVKENVLRDELNYAELGNALKYFFEKNPNATQIQAAEWCGFKNCNSGRVKVNKALKLMKLDQDLIAQVANEEIAVDKAMNEQTRRTQKAATEHLVDNQQASTEEFLKEDTPQTAETTRKPKHVKQQNISIPLEKAVNLVQLINWAAKQTSLEEIPFKKSPNRKDVLDALKNDVLDQLIKRISD